MKRGRKGKFLQSAGANPPESPTVRPSPYHLELKRQIKRFPKEYWKDLLEILQGHCRLHVTDLINLQTTKDILMMYSQDRYKGYQYAVGVRERRGKVVMEWEGKVREMMEGAGAKDVRGGTMRQESQKVPSSPPPNSPHPQKPRRPSIGTHYKLPPPLSRTSPRKRK